MNKLAKIEKLTKSLWRIGFLGVLKESKVAKRIETHWVEVLSNPNLSPLGRKSHLNTGNWHPVLFRGPKYCLRKSKVWLLSRDHFGPTIWAFRICTPFWPEVAHLTVSCGKPGSRVQAFVFLSRSWWLYVSFMFLVFSNVVLESQSNVLRVLSVIFKTLSKKVRKFVLK